MEHITSTEQFKNLVQGNKVGLMIHKQGCPYCEKAEPWVEDLSNTLTDRKIASVKKEDAEDLVELFNVKMYPTFVLLNNGVVSEVFFGDTQEEKVRDFLSKEF